METGEWRRAVLKDTAHFARLVDGLENMAFAMSMSNPEDVPTKDIFVYVFAEMVKNTNKPIVFIASNGRDIAKIYELACLVAGGEEELRRRPFILNYSEAISPLRFPKDVMEKLIFCAQKHIPLCLPSGSNAGGGAPVTLAGAMALGIAENLGGLVVHQLAGRGSPFLFGPNVSSLDMKSTVVSYGCPEWSLTQAALADMRDEIYGLPIWAFAGASDSKVMDAQAGAEAMFSILTAMLSRSNLIHDVGFLEYGSTSSLHCLRTLPEILKKTEFSGTAVLHDHSLLPWQGRQRAGCCYGLVFDLGTSTVVGKLINLLDGGEVGVVSRLNSQFKYGTNLISRLQYIKERQRSLEILHNLLITDLNRIARRIMAAAEITLDDIFIAVVAGNTTMQHFLLGLNPLGIAAAPFSPILRVFLEQRCAHLTGRQESMAGPVAFTVHSSNPAPGG